MRGIKPRVRARSTRSGTANIVKMKCPRKERSASLYPSHASAFPPLYLSRSPQRITLYPAAFAQEHCARKELIIPLVQRTRPDMKFRVVGECYLDNQQRDRNGMEVARYTRKGTLLRSSDFRH